MELVEIARWRMLSGFAALVVSACAAGGRSGELAANDSLHVRVLATHDFHGALRPVPGPDGRLVGGASALASVMDSVEAACGCPTFRLDGGDQMQGTLDSNLTFGASVVAALSHLGLDAAAVGNHELDWGVDTLLARQREAAYPWLAANVYRVADGRRPEWATPFTLVEREGVRMGVVGYATASTPRTLRADATAPYRFAAGFDAIRDAVDSVWQRDPDFVVIVAHAAGSCGDNGCVGEMVELAGELPPGAVHLIVGGHDHTAGGGVVNDVPIVRAGGNARAVGVIDLHRRRDGSHAFEVARVPVMASPDAPRAAMDELLEPHLRLADQRGAAPVTTLAERLSSSATGDRKLGTLIAEATRLIAEADVGFHNPGGTRADLPAGPITYADVHRVMPFDNAVVRLALEGRDLRRLAEQAGPRYYFAGLRVTFEDASGGRRAASLTLDGGPVQDDATYMLATNDFLAEGGDGFLMLADIPHEPIGITVLDAVVRQLRELPAPVRLAAP
jgi:2',3'-cyclic-nucleotide 2'-phosphodiesterase (5'-nucleotidase family)